VKRILARLAIHRSNLDRWTVIYLVISAFYPILRPSVYPSPWINALVHGVLAVAVWFLPPLLRRSGYFWPRLLGEIYLPILFPMLYKEMEYLGLIFFNFEASFDPTLIRLEELIFGCQPSLLWSRAWPWPWFHELMETAYFSYYFMALVMLILLLRSRDLSDELRWPALRAFVRDLGATMLICYTLYTLIPVWGPKYFRAGPVEVPGWIFTRIMEHIHANGAILGAAFPSSHVAATMIPWWYTWRWFPRHRWWMTVLFVLLCCSTVYCRYHYVVDVFAGLVLGAFVLYLGQRFGKVRTGEPRNGPSST